MEKIIQEIKLQILYDEETKEYYINTTNEDLKEKKVLTKKRKIDIDDIKGNLLLSLMNIID